MFQQIEKFLKQPSYMQLSLKYNSSFAILLGTLVSFMVYLMIWNLEGDYKLNDSLICGLIAILVFSANLSLLPQFLPDFFRADRWTMGRDILFTSWLFFAIGSVNMLMLRQLGWIDFQWSGFFMQQFFILLLGVPPVTALVVIRNKQYIQKHLKRAEFVQQLLLESPKAQLLLPTASSPLSLGPAELKALPMAVIQEKSKKKEEKIATISIRSNDNKIVSIPAKDLLVLHSEKGNLHIYWVNEDGMQYQKIKLRLKFVAEQVKDFSDFIHQTHRFFWVNLMRVEEIQGDARGLALKMPGIPAAVPVSKSHLKQIEAFFKS
jgi:DNA-binding LytR/AlgR family response regulator